MGSLLAPAYTFFVVPYTALGFELTPDYDERTRVVRWRIDRGEWQTSVRDRPVWCGVSGWYRPLVLAETLKSGPHTFELETIHGNTPDCKGCTTCIPFIASV